jgi:hypothetical protein
MTGTIALSSTQVEYIVATLTTKEVIWLTQLMKDPGLPQLQPIPLMCDNHSCIVPSKTTKKVIISPNTLTSKFIITCNKMLQA